MKKLLFLALAAGLATGCCSFFECNKNASGEASCCGGSHDHAKKNEVPVSNVEVKSEVADTADKIPVEGAEVVAETESGTLAL